jgi:hypothetical protein
LQEDIGGVIDAAGLGETLFQAGDFGGTTGRG